MGDMFRSEEMALCQFFIQHETAYAIVSLLGEAGVTQLRDLNPDCNIFQKRYVNEIRRAEEMERKMEYFTSEIKKNEINIPDNMPYPSAPNFRDIADLEAIMEKTENEIIEMNKNFINLKTSFQELVELKSILEKTSTFFEEQESGEINKALETDEPGTTAYKGDLGYVTGVVQRERVHSFETMLWRVSKSNVFFRKVDLEEPFIDPKTGLEAFKSVFIVFFQGEQLKTKVKKVCTGYHAKLYDCPSSMVERFELLREVKTRLQDLTMVLNQTEEHRHRVLVTVAKEVFSWKAKICKMKAIYHTLNCFSDSKRCLVGEGWVPVKDLDTVRQCLAEGSKSIGSSIQSFLNIVETKEEHPTFQRSNKFTRGFQNLIDSYGVANYREVNPALYTVITFPFLFGVMFGDMGHGAILLVFGAITILREKHFLTQKSKNEIWNIFFGGRYIILLMGLFSIYNGFIYNDIFSKSFNIFGSSWRVHYDASTVLSNADLQLDPATKDYWGHPYPVGVDPVWQLSENKIVFLNSYKMKLSIIFGVIHMIFGVCLSIANHVYYKKKMNILIQFLPEVIFLICIFFYLVVMIFMKWTWYDPQSSDFKVQTTCAPSVLILFINMIMFTKSTIQFQECNPYMYSNQELAQKILMIIAILCIPVMLTAKPIYILCFERKKKKQENALEQPTLGYENQELEGKKLEEDEEEPASEIIIHQIIHTIETVLSTISHTASYLRLWALSLAHAQLSEVLWTKVFTNGFLSSYAGCIAVFVVFAIWAFLTMAILVMMEGLSAFLHTLRLHWVEFMSKFYAGVGYQFQPFSFKVLLAQSENDEE